MSSAFDDAAVLERGNTSQVQSTDAKAVIPEVGQSGNSRNSDGHGSSTVASPADGDDLYPEHDTGQIGLARLKSFDGRFNFYPAFPTGRSLVLDSLAGQIQSIMSKMEVQRKKIKAKHHIEPCRLQQRKPDYRRWEKMTTKLWRKIKDYDAASVNAKTINEYECPREDALKTLQVWLNKQHSAQRHLYNGQDVDAFRMLGPRRGPIEEFVHETLPAMRATAFILRPFRARSSKTEDFEFHGYSEKVLNRIVGVISLLCLFVFVVIPLAFLACSDSNTTVKVSIVLTMCFLVRLLAQVTEKDEGRQWMLVFAYLATIGALLS